LRLERLKATARLQEISTVRLKNFQPEGAVI